jgi:hypothetical protein
MKPKHPVTTFGAITVREVHVVLVSEGLLPRVAVFVGGVDLQEVTHQQGVEGPVVAVEGRVTYGQPHS